MLLIICPKCFGQTRYYDKSKEFSGDGYTYLCEVKPTSSVTLYNKVSTFINVTQISVLTKERVKESKEFLFLSNDDESYLQCCTICAEVLGDHLVNAPYMSNTPLFVTMYINSQTGALQDVSFEFPYIRSYNTLSIGVYRTLELELKEKMKFTLTTEGRQMNYIRRKVIYFHE